MPRKTNKTNKSIQREWTFATIIVLLTALSVAFIVGFIKQAEIINKYELISRLDNQACRYLADRGNDSQVNGGFLLNTDAAESEAILNYYCYTGEKVQDRTIHGKPISGYLLGATVSYFSNNYAAEAYANAKLNPLRYWSEDGINEIQDKNYTFLVTDESEPYFDAYRVRANAVVRVSLPCKSSSFDMCNMQANQLLDQELKGINVL